MFCFNNLALTALQVLPHLKSLVLIKDNKKTWISTVVVPRVEAFALPIVLDRQREAHAEYKYTLVLHSQGTRVRIHIYAKDVPTPIGTRGIIYIP